MPGFEVRKAKGGCGIKKPENLGMKKIVARKNNIWLSILDSPMID
jgi:hypothetical protein